MTTRLQQQLALVRGKLRRVLWVYGLCWLLSILVGGLLVCGLLDWLMHIDDPIVRLILATSVVGSSLVVAWKQLWRPLTCPFSDVELALKVERQFPALHDQLASAVEFSTSDPRHGSPVLQRDLVAVTDASVSELDLTSAVDTRRLRGIGSLTGLVVLFAVLLLGLRGTEASTAMARLFLPFADHEWPRSTDLQFVTADLAPWPFEDERTLRAGRGATLELFVVNRRRTLPADLQVELRYPDGELSRQALPVQRRTVDGREWDVAKFDLLAMEQQVEFRVVGGDHVDMPWHRLDVVPPPELTELQVRLVPPKYTRQDPVDLPPGNGHVQGLLGTRVEWRARSRTKLTSATLRRADGSLTPLTIGPDGRTLRTTFVIDQTGSHTYAVLLNDQEGFTSPDPPQFEVRGIPDQSPETRVRHPGSDIQVVPQATIRIEASVKDDLGLDRIWLAYQCERQLPGRENEAAQKILLKKVERELETEISYAWELAPLDLRPGDRLLFHIEATDICNLDRQQTHQSSVQLATVVTVDEKRSELRLREAELFEELARIAQTQDQARDVVADLRIQLDKAGSLQSRDLDLLRRVEFDQRRIGNRLVEDGDSAQQRGRELRLDIADNSLQMPETVRRLELLESELRVLQSDQLPTIESHLTRVRKQSQAAASAELSLSLERPAERRTDLLSMVLQSQSAVIDALEMLVGLLATWQSERDVASQLQDAIELQTELNAETARVGQRTATRRLQALTAQEQADLARLANRQRANERELTEFRTTLLEQRQALGGENPRRELYQNALDSLDRQALLGRMQELAGLLEDNRIGEVSRRQQSLLEDLLELQEQLDQQRATDAEQLVNSLREAEALAETLYAEAVALVADFETLRAAAEGDGRAEREDLAERESALAVRANDLARKLRRLNQDAARDAADAAADALDEAAGDLKRGDPQRAQTAHGQAVQQLDQTRRQITSARSEIERDMNRTAVQRLESEVRVLAETQQQLIDATRAKQQEFTETPRWTRAQLKELVELARSQESLATAAGTLARSLESLEVVALALRGAGVLMQQAATRIRERQTDAATLATQARARARLLDLVETLATEKSTAGSSPAAGTGTGDAGSGQQQPTIDIVQLKLVAQLQDQLADEIADLDRLRQTGQPLSDAQRNRLEQLADEQDALTRVIRRILEQPDGP